MTTEMTVFHNAETFELVQRQAKLLASSDLAPPQFKGNLANCVIALDMAQRLRANPLAIMQEIYIVHGKPSFSSKFVIAAINQCGRFEPLEFELSGEGDKRSCRAHTRAINRPDREIFGPPASIAMAKAEGWYQKNGSKWQTMPELMLHYRAATFFGRLYAPELLFGMRTKEEIYDAGEAKLTPANNPFVVTECDPLPALTEPAEATEKPMREPGEDEE
jgi:hypothetical protein